MTGGKQEGRIQIALLSLRGVPRRGSRRSPYSPLWDLHSSKDKCSLESNQDESRRRRRWHLLLFRRNLTLCRNLFRFRNIALPPDNAVHRPPSNPVQPRTYQDRNDIFPGTMARWEIVSRAQSGQVSCLPRSRIFKTACLSSGIISTRTCGTVAGAGGHGCQVTLGGP
jgi:hypothetical protein